MHCVQWMAGMRQNMSILHVRWAITSRLPVLAMTWGLQRQQRKQHYHQDQLADDPASWPALKCPVHNQVSVAVCSIYCCRFLSFIIGTACIVWNGMVSIHLSVPAWPCWLLQVCCCGPSGQEISIDCCSSGMRQANLGSATLSAYVGGWTQTCFSLICTFLTSWLT